MTLIFYCPTPFAPGFLLSLSLLVFQFLSCLVTEVQSGCGHQVVDARCTAVHSADRWFCSFFLHAATRSYARSYDAATRNEVAFICLYS